MYSVKKISFSIACFFAMFIASAQIPIPSSIEWFKGRFYITDRLSVKSPERISIDIILSQLSGRIEVLTNKKPDFKPVQSKPSLEIAINSQFDPILGREGYRLSVNAKSISIRANNDTGSFYGSQTLHQLLSYDLKNHQFYFPAVSITDTPRFAWRGIMLDVSRHFFTKEEIKRLLDQMVQYKFNTLHLHLSDDNGWRIEIKSLPILNSVGAWRVPRTGQWGTFTDPQRGESSTYGGYYTQDDIKEIVQYASDRFVTVVPEIDIPGHSQAMIASYPNLSCTGLQYAVDPGSYSEADNVLCAGNDSVFSVLEKVYSEIAQLFPSQYIHIGGDEVDKKYWSACPKCQKRMKENGIVNMDGLQSYFIKRVSQIVNSTGKKVIGWDEIIDGGLAEDAAVMSWRGMNGGIIAAKLKHPVVMTPWDNCYLDLYQGDSTAEPHTYGLCRLSDSYNFDPVPKGVDPRYILGGQGNIWTEAIPDFRQLEYMAYPRAFALAENFWSPKEKKNWPDFVKRVENEMGRLDAQGVKYARSAYNAITKVVKDKDGVPAVKVSTEIPGLDIHYSFDGITPDYYYPKYAGVLLRFPAGATQLKIVTYRGKDRIGKEVFVNKSTLEIKKSSNN